MHVTETPVQAHPGRETSRGSRGNMLLVVTVVALVASAITVTFLLRTEKSAMSTTDMLKRRQTFYVADGMSRIAIEEVQAYLFDNPDPSTADLGNPDNIPPPEVPGYELEQFNLESAGDAYYGLVPNGPFEGMNALQKPVAMDIVARTADGGYRADVHLNVLLGKISMFQFFVFGAGYTDVFPGPAMTVNPGRVHANGDLCLGSNNKFRIDRVTASGRILASDPRCRRTAGKGVWVSNGTDYVFMDSSTSSGCTDCDGSGMDWAAYAASMWQGHVKDQAHGVPILRLPVTGTPDTQAGLNARQEKISNANTTRVLIDPVRPEDSGSIRDQKFAWKADVRILDGVWYINDGTWPGKPIWSDHPGSFSTRPGGLEGDTVLAVGQSDLADALGWPSVPHRFSYYEYDPVSQRLFEDHRGVISYGTLFRDGSRVVPGFWAQGSNSRTYTDVDGHAKSYFCDRCNGQNKCTAALKLRPASEPLCETLEGGVPVPMFDVQYLQGARSGFTDYRVQNTEPDKGHILPVNFDLEAFAQAMADTTPGELGSYFDGGATFNGIVYIAFSWAGSMDGFPGDLPALWPSQGTVSDPTQARSYSTSMVQDALPFPLCSDSLGFVPGSQRIALSGPPSNNDPDDGFEPYFTVPTCNDAVTPTGRPNAVRFVNGAAIDMDTFPNGLSLVTNLPAYVLGSTNTNSDASSASATPWVPILFAADALTLLSDNWEDDEGPWFDTCSGFCSRVATNSTYHLLILSGNVETADSSHYGGGVENFPRFLENWSGKTTSIAGAFVIGFASVYQRQPWKYGSPIYNAPKRNWFFDNHLSSLAHQPPGAPLFSIHSVTRMNRPAITEE